MIRSNFIFQKSKSILISLFFLISILFLGCKEDILDVGINILADDELLNASFDTIDVDAYTIAGEGVYTYRRSVSPLGSYHNETYGDVQCDILFNYFRTQTFTIPDNYEILSVELRIDYSSYIGDISNLDFDIYEITGEFPPDSIYSDYEVTAEMISPTPVSTGFVDTADGIIEVPLQVTFGEMLFDESAWEPGDSIYKTDSLELFWKYFKGLYIKADIPDGTGALAYTSLFSDNSGLWVKYVNDDEDTLYFGYDVMKSHNLYRFDYEQGTINEPGTMTEEEHIYLQSLGGARALIHFPELEIFRNSSEIYSIHKAELVFHIDSNLIDTNGIPSRLALKYLDDEDNELPLADYYGFENYFNGYVNTNNWECKMNISNWVQSYISRDTEIYTDPSLILHIANYVHTDNGSYVYRMDYITSSYYTIPFFTGSSSYPIELRLIYSVIE